MKKSCIVLALLLCSICSLAQVKQFDRCNPEDVFRFFRGDTVIISCDTVYTLTSSRFLGYELMRLTLQKNNNLLFTTITQMKQNYEKQIERQNSDYVTLKALYDKCDANATGSLKMLDLSLSKSIGILDTANLKIDSTRVLINQTRDLIKKDMKRQLGNKLLWGAGGVVVGLSISTAILLLVAH